MSARKTFAELVEGDEARWRHVVTAADVDAFGQLSGDTNPVHFDDEAALRFGFRGRIAHGMLLGSFVSRVLGTRLPGPGALWLSQDFRFARPVYVGQEIEVVVRVRRKGEGLGTLLLETEVLNESGDEVLTGEARVMVLQPGEQVPLEEMVAVVTGASRGIGAAIAESLGGEGVRVVVNYVGNEEAADSVVATIQDRGGEAIAVQADVGTEAGVQALAEASLDAFGRVDVLVSNASPPIEPVSFMELDWEEIERYLSVYARGAVSLTQAFVPGMKERGFGRIVHVLSSYVLNVPPTEMSAYVTAKSAAWGLCKSMAVELAPLGITVNAISPSPVMTEQWDDVDDSSRRALAMRSPLRRLPVPGEVARAVLFFLGEGGGYCTGVNLPLAGGEVM